MSALSEGMHILKTFDGMTSAILLIKFKEMKHKFLNTLITDT